MPNAYKQVALTYVQKTFSGVLPAIMVFSQLVAIGVGVPLAVRTRDINLPLLMVGELFLLGMIMPHLKEQLASTRSILWPHYRRAHLVVGVGILSVPVLIVPLMIMGLRPLHSAGLLAFITCLAALIGWCVLRPGPQLFIGMIGWFALLSPQGDHFLTGFVTGQYEPLARLLLLVGLIGLGIVLARMAMLNEEMPDYRKQGRTSAWQLKARSTGETSQVQTSPGWTDNLLSLVMDWKLARLQGGNRAGSWQQIRRWQLPVTLLWPCLIGLSAGPYAVLLGGIISPLNVLSVMQSMIFIIPLTMIGPWLQRWRTIGYESLRPVSRADLFRQMGLSMAVDLFYATAALITGIALSVVLFMPQMPGNISLWLMLAMLPPIQVFFFGISVWFLRYRQTSWIVASAFLSVFPISLMVSLIEKRLVDYRLPAILGTFVLAGVGVLLTRLAYRRWLMTDLD